MSRNTVLVILFLCGCGYRIEGRAVPGGFGTVTWVDAEDQRLQQRGIPGVRVQLVRDPDRMRREVVAEATSAADGSFTLDTRSFGAGWMDERWEITASGPGSSAAATRTELPMNASDRRLLIELGQGDRSSVAPREAPGNLYDEAAKWDPSIQRKPASP